MKKGSKKPSQKDLINLSRGLVEVFIRYNLRITPFPAKAFEFSAGSKGDLVRILHGTILDEGERKTICIDSLKSDQVKRLTLIHETIHGFYSIEGYQQDEDEIDKLARYWFKHLYGYEYKDSET